MFYVVTKTPSTIFQFASGSTRPIPKIHPGVTSALHPPWSSMLKAPMLMTMVAFFSTVSATGRL